MIFMHKHTGSIDTQDGWIESYAIEELEARGLTADEAFGADRDVTLIQITPEYCSQNDGDCGSCSLVNCTINF